MPFHPNGKPLHVHGFLGWFKRLGESNAKKLRQIEALGVPMIGIDPSMTMTYRSEYKEAAIDVPSIQLVQEFLAAHLDEFVVTPKLPVKRFRLFAHCTEATNAKDSLALWQSIFAMVGQSLEIVICWMLWNGRNLRSRKSEPSDFEDDLRSELAN